MPAKLIDGKGIADAVIANIYEQVSALGVPLHLAAICPRNDFELKSFIKLKQKAAQAAGITFSSYFFEAESQDDFMATLDYISSDDTIDGMFVELPLPEGWDREKVLSHIPISKDVDVISPAGERAFYSDESVVLPPSVKALEYALMECGLELSGANCAVVGQGRLIGLPISHWLESQGATVARI